MAASRQRAQASESTHLVIDGRRWRKSDPSIPEKLRSELVHALMDARRAVLAAKRAADPAAEKAARARVQDAKLALGERGEPYWEERSEAGQRKRAAATMRALLAHRAARSGAREYGACARGRSGARGPRPTARATARPRGSNRPSPRPDPPRATALRPRDVLSAYDWISVIAVRLSRPASVECPSSGGGAKRVA
jgi:hypothetical protein